MPDGADAGRFLHDDEMAIDVADRNLIDDRRRTLGMREDLDDITFLEPASFIEPDVAVDFDAARIDELANLRPALPRQPEPQEGAERFAGLLDGDRKVLGWHLAHYTSLGG